MPWMGKGRSAPRHSTRLINVFVAGMLVFMGIHAAANAAPVLKPHRLERSNLPQQSTHGAALDMGHTALRHLVATPIDHAFVQANLSILTLVTDDPKAQMAPEDIDVSRHGLRLAQTVSPRGPPETLI